jgi:hypothetical protein
LGFSGVVNCYGGANAMPLLQLNSLGEACSGIPRIFGDA